jgi:hypothetical protein
MSPGKSESLTGMAGLHFSMKISMKCCLLSKVNCHALVKNLHEFKPHPTFMPDIADNIWFRRRCAANTLLLNIEAGRQHECLEDPQFTLRLGLACHWR